jgi:hypothetical protein
MDTSLEALAYGILAGIMIVLVIEAKVPQMIKTLAGY